jgi:two-component system chemotaxis sensor kinase CheA
MIDKIFRLAHNIKGSAQAVGFSEIGEFSHKLESLLLKIKKGDIKLSTPTVTLLLECNDYLRSSVESLKRGETLAVDEKLAARVLNATGGQAHTEGSINQISDDLDLDAQLDQIMSNSPELVEGLASPLPTDQLLADAAAFASTIISELTQENLAPISPTPPPNTSKEHAPKARTTDTPDESIRVSLSRVEKLVDNIGELVILQTVLTENRHQLPTQFLQKTITQLAKISKEIQDIAMGLRLVPLKQTFQKMQRIVRDTAQSLNKDVLLEISGEDSELDKTVVDRLGDPLVHLVRNAVDHGLESTEARLAAGKSSQGTIKLRAYHRSGRIAIEVRDDGHGLNPDLLRKKGIEKGLISANQNYSDQELFALIFHPGFSTKSAVTDISGRGVGLDVVKTNIEKLLQGEVQLETVRGEGTCFRITLPLTMAIIDGMVVRAGRERYIVPLTHVHESVRPRQNDISSHTGLGLVLNLRGEAMPMHRLARLLGDNSPPQAENREETAIVVRSGTHPYAIIVDEIVGRQQVVIKKLGDELANVKGMSGGAILGDGCAAVILDLNELMHQGTAKSKPVVASIRGAA